MEYANKEKWSRITKLFQLQALIFEENMNKL
jgi:hypothetical protein